MLRIAGVFFTLEVVLGEISGSGLGMIVISSVVSSVFTQAVAGTQPAFSVPAYAFEFCLGAVPRIWDWDC